MGKDGETEIGSMRKAEQLYGIGLLIFSFDVGRSMFDVHDPVLASSIICFILLRFTGFSRKPIGLTF